jgi:hypothetical protein
MELSEYNFIDWSLFIASIRNSTIEFVEYEEIDNLISIFFYDIEYVINISAISNHSHFTGMDQNLGYLKDKKLKNLYFSSTRRNFNIHFVLFDEPEFVCTVWHEINGDDCSLDIEFNILNRLRNERICEDFENVEEINDIGFSILRPSDYSNLVCC